MRYTDAIKDLQYGRGRKFALTGDESYLKDQFELLAKKVYSYPVFTFYPEEEEDAQSALFSSFESNRIVILKNFDQMSVKKFYDLISGFDGLLILNFSDNANLKLASITSAISLCTHVQCNGMSPFGSDYPSWLVSKANEKSYLFVESAEDVLYKRVGPDMFSLMNELHKLMLYKKESKSITPDDVEKVISGSTLTSTYDIFEAIIRKEAAKALRYLDMYFKGSDDITSLVGFFGHYFEKLYRILLLKEAGTSPEGMADILGIPAFIVKTKYLSRAIALGKENISACIDRLCALEVRLRTYRGNKRILLDSFIFSLAD